MRRLASTVRVLGRRSEGKQPPPLSPFAAAQIAFCAAVALRGEPAVCEESGGGLRVGGRSEWQPEDESVLVRSPVVARDGGAPDAEAHTEGLLHRKLRAAVERAGVAPRDVPLFLITLSGMKWLTLLGTVGICAMFKPLTRFALTRSGLKLTAWTARTFPRGTLWVRENLLKAKGSKYGRFLPPALVRGLGEGMVLYKLTAPVWLPLEIWALAKAFQRGALGERKARANAERKANSQWD
jgi:hypothetical protein